MKYLKGQVWENSKNTNCIILVQRLMSDGRIEISRQFLSVPPTEDRPFGLPGVGHACRVTRDELDLMTNGFVLQQKLAAL